MARTCRRYATGNGVRPRNRSRQLLSRRRSLKRFRMADASLANLGTVAAVRGSVVDVRFEHLLPPLYSVLRAGTDAQIVIEVMTQLNAHCVRGIALTPTQGLARGVSVTDTGAPLQAPIGKNIISRMFDVFGRAIDHEPEPLDVKWRSIHRAPPPLSE